MRPRIDASGRRAMAAGHALLAMLIALGMGALLNADSLRAAAEHQPFGWRRSVAVTLVRPVDGLSGLLRLDRPRVAIDRALGRAPVEASGAKTRPILAPDATTDDPAATDSEPPPSPSAEPRSVDAGDRLSVFVVGDSLTETMGPALAEQMLDVADVTHDFRYSTGLSRPDFFDWPARFDQIIAESDPDAFVVMFGGNDAQDIRTTDGILPLGSPEWVEAYGSRVGGVMDRLTADGQAVIWVGMPVMRSTTFDARARMLNEIYAGQAAARQRVTFLDTRAMFAAADGSYADYLPDLSGTTQLMRRRDGIHLSPAGGTRLATAVAEILAQAWDLEPQPSPAHT